MDLLPKLLLEISVPTGYLKLKSVQEILLNAKKYYKSGSSNKDFWSQVAQTLWSHLQIGLNNMDEQLLCATCFFTVITFLDNISVYIEDLLQNINDELLKRQNNKPSLKTCHVVSMMYGMFQSSFLNQITQIHIPEIALILKHTIDLLIFMGYEYSQYTFLVFKTIKSFQKAHGTDLQEYIFNKEHIIKLLNLVNHNWENPVTGVRDLNRSIFQTILTTVDDEMYKQILDEIHSFYWNKAKYLMLTEVIQCNRGDKIPHARWVDGLTSSLYKPGLVSAGADMYYAVLIKIKTEHEWCHIFLNNIGNIFNNTNNKAIENFNNYWCKTTLKKFPGLTHILLNELKKQNNSNHKLYSSLCLLKQANKLGIIEKERNSTMDVSYIESTVFSGIENCNTYIRMLAFDVVCVSNRKTAPASTEYKLIYNFLVNNVNSDCTVLRLSMLSSLNDFLTQLHSIFLNNIIKNGKNSEIDNLLEFCKDIQALVKDSLNLNGNYQRKITCVKLCELINKCFADVPTKKKAQIRQGNVTLLEFLKEKRYWLLSDGDFIIKLLSLLKDPADDVRESVIKILLNHNMAELKNGPILLGSLINDALKCMGSKFFYEISCSQSMFKLITNIVIIDNEPEITFKSPEDIIFYGFNELITEYKMKREVMNSIETGRQLHSFMSILLVVVEVCKHNAYNIDISSEMADMLDTLKGISNQFSWEQDNSKSSDFAKMNDMVQKIITDSGYNPCNEADHSKISGLQQIVLNNLWLNVKASCDLASVLIYYNTDNAMMSGECLNIITHVLETSRHKGAIEAAGVALGRAIQCLTSLPEENEVSKVPQVLLKCKLDDLISETNTMSSITRRGAGLSIMVHRIVSNDMRRGKPLFHFFMNTILEVCSSVEDIPILSLNQANTENQVDLPKAIYIHFMTRIVTDSSLASELMYYSPQLAELAFGNLISSQWQIRNAALQLYGALLPRLIGQKKASGVGDETIATIGYDELRTHSPKLWKYIQQQLLKTDAVGTIQCHSNIVPILNLLASTAKRYNFESDTKEHRSSDTELLKCLRALLGSPIYTVRRLAAKCIFNITEFDSIYNALIIEECVSENSLHGNLLLLCLCHEFYSSDECYEAKFDSLREKFGNLLRSRKHSYLCQKLFESIFINAHNMIDIGQTLHELRNSQHLPGVSLWAKSRLKKYIDTCSWSEIPDLLKLILQQSDSEDYCRMVLTKRRVDNNVSKEVFIEISTILLTSEKRYNSSVFWEILYEISSEINLRDQINIGELIKKLDDKKSMYKLRYMIPFLARHIETFSNDIKLTLAKFVSDLGHFENYDVDTRYIAALANNELASQFDQLNDEIKLHSIKCAVVTLQDEDVDIRDLSVMFYKILSKQQAMVHPYICLKHILSSKFLTAVFSDSKTFVAHLRAELTDILNSNRIIDVYNPFANDSKNIYLETEVLRTLIQSLDV